MFLDLTKGSYYLIDTEYENFETGEWYTLRKVYFILDETIRDCYQDLENSRKTQLMSHVFDVYENCITLLRTQAIRRIVKGGTKLE
jgi:hypothetical protein